MNHSNFHAARAFADIEFAVSCRELYPSLCTKSRGWLKTFFHNSQSTWCCSVHQERLCDMLCQRAHLGNSHPNFSTLFKKRHHRSPEAATEARGLSLQVAEEISRQEPMKANQLRDHSLRKRLIGSCSLEPIDFLVLHLNCLRNRTRVCLQSTLPYHRAIST